MKIQIPSQLEARFGRLRRRLRRVQTLQALLAVFTALGVSYLAVFFLDRGWDTAPAMRTAILGAGWAMASWAAFRWMFCWIVRPPGVKELAALVQRRHRQLGDRLLGIVELADESARPPHFSEELYEAAIQQVSADALHYDFDQAASTLGLRRLAVASVVLGLILAALGGVFPGAIVNAFSRWSTPYREIPRYTLVRIENLRAAGIAVHDEAFEAIAEVRYQSFWRPEKVRARFEGERPLEASAKGGRLRVQVPGQHNSRVLEVRLGDASALLSVEPVFRPKLVEISGQERLPAYLEQPDREVKISGGVLEVLEGSAVSFRGKISRNLASAALRCDGKDEPSALTVDGTEFSSAPLHLTNVYKASLSWRDALGLENSEPWRFAIRHKADQQPSIDLPELGFDSAILDTEVLALRVTSRDDFGIQEFGLNWRWNTEPPPSATLRKEEFYDRSLNRSQTELDATFYFSPVISQIPAGTTLEFRGFATDFHPARQPVETAAYRVHVLSSVEHAEFIRSRLETLLTHLEEISRLQEKLAAASANLRENLDGKPEILKNRLQDQLDDQTANAAQLNLLAQQGFETLREAMRNARFTDAMMKQWTETMTQMESLAQQKMANALQSLHAAQKNPAKRSPNLADAQQIQEEILQELEAMQSGVNENLDAMEAMTLAERLRAIGNEESEIEQALMEQAAATIGLFPNELAPRFQANNERLAETQTTASQKTQQIQQEISRFFERTQRKAYGEVSQSIQASEATEKLLQVRRQIQDNISMQAVENLADWAEQFHQWAELLNPDSSQNPGGGDGNGSNGENATDLTQLLMSLLRLRENELTLRAQTQLLNQKRDSKNNPNAKTPTTPKFPSEQATQLAQSQIRIQEKLNAAITENPLPEIDVVLQEANNQMDKVTQLLQQNQTGEPTIAGETDAVHILTDAVNLINEQARRKNPDDAGIARQIAIMMQMASIEQGQTTSSQPSASGNQTGGNTNQSAQGQAGNAAGNANNPGNVPRFSRQTANPPTEFRRAFEHYFQKLEQLETAWPPPASASQTLPRQQTENNTRNQ